MSKCPDARKCETLFIPSLLKLSSIVNFTLSFIAYETANGRIECMHGEDECIGNRQQLCVQHLYPQASFLRFLQCQTQRIGEIPHNAERCVKELVNDKLNWQDIDRCVKTNLSTELFLNALRRTRNAGARKSCTMYLNGKFWCMHDGYWSGCSQGNDEKSFMNAICSRYSGTPKPPECMVAL